MRQNTVLRWILIVVILSSLFVLVYYFLQTGENPFVAVTTKPQPTLEDEVAFKKEIVVFDSVTPSVYAVGDLVSHKFVINEDSGERELYVVFYTEDKYIPAKVEYVVSTGSNLNVRVGDLEDVGELEKTFSEVALTNSTSLTTYYLSLFSLQSQAQSKECANSGRISPTGFCDYERNEKSYTSDQLVKIIQSALERQRPAENLELSEYIDPEGNINVSLQINFDVTRNQ